jgi:hypothetical protein
MDWCGTVILPLQLAAQEAWMSIDSYVAIVLERLAVLLEKTNREEEASTAKQDAEAIQKK